MIYVPKNHTNQMIDRHAGALRLLLPMDFRARLDSAVKESLRDMPSKPLRELQTLVAGQVALTLRASEFSKVLEDALREERDYADHQFQKEQWVQRETVLKPRHSVAVNKFEKETFGSHTVPDGVKEALREFREYCAKLPPDDEKLLVDWAETCHERGLRFAHHREAK